MRVAVHQPQYLPWLGYFHKIRECDVFVFQDDVQYKHREFQNRNRIKTPEGPLWLTVPVFTKGKRDQPILDVKINKDEPWQRKHWHAIEKNYRGAPHFDRYAPILEAYYAEPHDSLCELNIGFIRFVLGELQIDTPLHLESQLKTGSSTGEQRIVEVAGAVGADTYFSGAGGRDWMDLDVFARGGVGVEFQSFDHPEYPQQFGEFTPYLSILDLLLNAGPESAAILNRA